MLRPALLLKNNTLTWVIRIYNTSGALVDADSTPTVAVRKNGSSTGDSVTVTKRSATTGIYDCSYNPASEVEGDQFTIEETATVASTTTSWNWSFMVIDADVTGKVLGGGSGTISGVGAYVKDHSGNAVMPSGSVTLATSQPNYAPAKAGDAMTLTSDERTAVANEVESQIIDDTDSERVLQAIVDKIAAANPSLEGLTLSAIASAIRTELAIELARIDATVTSRLAATAYTAPDNAGIASAEAAANSAATAASSASTAAAAALAIVGHTGYGNEAISNDIAGISVNVASAEEVWAYQDRTLTMTVAEIAAVQSGNDLVIHRGDTTVINITGLGSLVDRVGTKLYFTVKDNLADSDSESIVQITETGGLLILNGEEQLDATIGSLVVNDEIAGNVTITLKSSMTKDLQASLTKKYSWDIQIIKSGNRVNTLTQGILVVNYDVTQANS